ncbi:MAG: PAS domain-containing protein [Deltaproteobacteria bacterium]|nr:PAS domain-containing protein [Deltaproteobacteria bacterium]
MKRSNISGEGFSLRRRLPFPLRIEATALGVLLFALLSLLLLVYGDRMWRTSFRTSVPLLESLMFARTTLAEGNLWFEELLDGNRAVDPEMVWDFYAIARSVVEACMGGVSGVAGLPAEPPDDPEVRLRLAEFAEGIQELESLARLRWAGAKRGEPGTLEQRFRAAVHGLGLAADLLVNRIRERIQADLHRQAFVHRATLTIWFAVLAALFGLFFYSGARRRKAERALRSSEARYRAVVEDQTEMICRFGPDLRLTFVNRAFAQAFSEEGADLTGRRFTDLLPASARGAVQEACGRLEKGPAGPVVIRIDSPGDSPVWQSWVFRSFAGENGEPGGCQGVGRDITAEKTAEERIRSLSRRLLRAREMERRKLSWDLHDRVAQDLPTLKMGIDVAKAGGRNADSSLSREMTRLSRLVQQCIDSVRGLSAELLPAGLETLGLVETVRKLCIDFERQTGVRVDFLATGVDRIPLDMEAQISLYRIVQEGLANIRKHAGASRVEIRLLASFPHVLLRVRDDGRGFDPASPGVSRDGGHMGVWSMQERTGLAGGDFQLTSRPGEGTCIIVEIPQKEARGDEP